MASYEQQAEVLSRLSSFSDRNKTNFNKRDAVLHEIQRHRENKAAIITFRNNLLDSQKSKLQTRIRKAYGNNDSWFSEGCTIQKIHQPTNGSLKGTCQRINQW